MVSGPVSGAEGSGTEASSGRAAGDSDGSFGSEIGPVLRVSGGAALRGPAPGGSRIVWKGERRTFVKDLFVAARRFGEGLPPAEEEQEEEHRIGSGDVILDCRAQRVWSRGRWNALTPIEFRLMHLLMSRPGTPHLPRELVSRVWGYGEEGRSDPPIRWHIKNLREKVEPDPLNPRFLRTLPRRGYLFDPGPPRKGASSPASTKDPARREEPPSGWAELLGALTEGFPGALGVTLQGKILWWNGEAERLLGIPREELLGREFLPFLREDRRFFWRAGRSWPHGADGREDWRFVLEVRRPSGEIVPVEGVFAGRVLGGVFFETWSFAALPREGERERLQREFERKEGIRRAAFRAREMLSWVFSPGQETLLLEEGLKELLEVGLSGPLEISLSCFLSRWVCPEDRDLLRDFLRTSAVESASPEIRLRDEGGRTFPAVFHAVRVPGLGPEDGDFRLCGVCAEVQGAERRDPPGTHRFRRLAAWAMHCVDLPVERSVRAGLRVLEWTGRSLEADRGGLFRCVPETGCVERIHAWGRGWGEGPRRRRPAPEDREWLWRLFWEGIVVPGPAERGMVERCFGGGEEGSWLLLPVRVAGVQWGVQLYGWDAPDRRFSPGEMEVLRFASELGGKMAERGIRAEKRDA